MYMYNIIRNQVKIVALNLLYIHCKSVIQNRMGKKTMINVCYQNKCRAWSHELKNWKRWKSKHCTCILKNTHHQDYKGVKKPATVSLPVFESWKIKPDRRVWRQFLSAIFHKYGDYVYRVTKVLQYH